MEVPEASAPDFLLALLISTKVSGRSQRATALELMLGLNFCQPRFLSCVTLSKRPSLQHPGQNVAICVNHVVKHPISLETLTEDYVPEPETSTLPIIIRLTATSSVEVGTISLLFLAIN